MAEAVLGASGNVFADLGFEPAEATILHMRAQLLSDLREFVQASGLSPSKAAARLGLTRSRADDLIRGDWQKFSLEALITLEARAGRTITLHLAV